MQIPLERTFHNRLSCCLIAVFALTVALLSVPSYAAAQYVHVRLNQPLLQGQHISEFYMSPDGAHVLYVLSADGDADIPTSSSLYSVPIGGGTPVLLDSSPPDEMPAMLVWFQISPDSKYVVYMKEIDSEGGDIPTLPGLYSVPITGGVPVRLNLPVDGAEGRVGLAYWISPDSRHVVYGETIDGEQYTWPRLQNLFSVPISGGVPIRLDPAIDGGAVIDGFSISPDSVYVVFQHGTDASPVRQLYSVPIDGGAPVRLGAPISAERGFGYRISPDSGYVVYNVSVSDRLWIPNFYSVPVSGGASVRLEFPVDYLELDWTTFSADSRHIVAFCSWQHMFAIYSFPVEGGKPIHLSEASEFYVSSHYTPGSSLFLSVDGTKVLYPTWDDARKRHLLVAVPVTGGTPVELAAGATPAQVLGLQELMPGGDHVLYTVYEPNATTLYSAPLADGAPVRLMELVSANYDHEDWRLYPSPDGHHVVILQNGVPGIVSVPVTGGAPVVLSLAGGDILSPGVGISPDGSHVLSRDNYYDPLYIVPIDGGTPLMVSDSVGRYRFSSDGSYLVYQTQETDLYVTNVAIDWLHVFLPRMQSP